MSILTDDSNTTTTGDEAQQETLQANEVTPNEWGSDEVQEQPQEEGLSDASGEGYDEDNLDAFAEQFFAQEGADKEPPAEAASTSTTEEDGDDGEEEATDESTGEDESGEEPKQEEPAGKPKSRFQERIDQLTQKAREAERREQELRQRLEELEKGSQDDKEESHNPSASTQANNVPPNPNDVDQDGNDLYPLGEFDPNYIRDLTRYTVQEEQARIQQEQQVSQQRQALDKSWSEKVSQATQELTDFTEKVQNLESTFADLDPDYGDFLAQTIKTLDNGPEVLYHLANNLEEAKAAVSQGPLAAALKLGEYNALVAGQKKGSTGSSSVKPRVSSAPPPPVASTQGRSSVNTVAPDTEDLDAFSAVFFQS